MFSLREHLSRSNGFRLWLKRSSLVALLGCFGVAVIGVPLHAQTPTTLPEDQLPGSDRLRLFAWCTGRATPAPGSDLMARDHDCAVLADGLARVFDQAVEFLKQYVVATQEQARMYPDDAEKRRQFEENFQQFNLGLVFGAPMILCQAFNDRRLGRHTDSGSCSSHDERMDGSGLDLAALVEQNPDKLPRGPEAGISPRQGDPQSGDALPEIARARFLHEFPIGSSTDKATAWLQSLGCICEIDQCKFSGDKWGYQSGGLRWSTFDWIITLKPGGTGTIANVEIRLGTGPVPL